LYQKCSLAGNLVNVGVYLFYCLGGGGGGGGGWMVVVVVLLFAL
jgi:hypothetical protein